MIPTAMRPLPLPRTGVLRRQSERVPQLVRSLLLAVSLLLAASPVIAQSSSSGSGAVQSGSGTDIWQLRRERALGFTEAWGTFAPIFASWQGKWEKAHGKMLTHIDRCRIDVRTSNRDTILPVTLQCYRGQLLLEQESLKREREVIKAWPGISDGIRTQALQEIDDLLSAIQPVIDAIDAKVFGSIAAFKDVRQNLRTQYRNPYWIAEAHLRADAARTWLAHLLVRLQPLITDTTLPSESVQKITTALACYEEADPLLATAAVASTLEESTRKFREAAALLKNCRTPLSEAQSLQSQSSSASSSQGTSP